MFEESWERRPFSSGDVMEKWKPVLFLELLSRKEVTPEQEGEGA